MDFREKLDELSEEEFVQIRSAATWYAKFHARMIAERMDDTSAMAVGQRERYKALIGGLRKVGARIFDPTVPVTSLLPVRDEQDEKPADSQAA
ncbi:MAG TPA: hypothetical protein VF770_02785 [Solirubrobacterales bacterium]